ncbi:hypothetical protein [Streptomyces armeniacus]|uniref:hypothetical protein n=1 Tax=Streptomyces armeniacus TaxID=83291 RepID=UPI001AD83D8B|nr:hypothetical protein [Streptomyces armeniacus]
MPPLPKDEEIAELIPDLGVIESMFRQMEWAESEIAKAQERHGEKDQGPIWRTFPLLAAPQEQMSREILFRSHCHELLERVAKGTDTRAATDAEILAVLVEASLTAPLTSAAAFLFFRLANRSVPELIRAMEPAIDLTAYETVHGHQADEHEDYARQKLRKEMRTLPK